MNNYNLLLDYAEYARHFLKVTTKDKGLVPLEFNTYVYQHRLHKLIERLVAENKPVRIIVLKARQTGISTFCAGYVYHQCVTSKYTKGMMIAHDSDSTANLFTMVKRMYDFAPEKMKPMSRYSNRRELVFENPDEKTRANSPGLLSSIEVDTAGKTTAGRSSTIHHLHISELAFWTNATVPLSGLLQAVPNKPGTTIIIESTAQGIVGDGETFYEMWSKAIRRESDFVPFFIPWYENPDYCLPGADKDFEITGEERDATAGINITDGQLAWRRWKIKNDFNDDEKLFCQEFPSTPEEAFILSGRPVFDIRLLQRRMAGIDRGGEIVGDAVIYEAPVPDKVYVCGADVAEGLEQGDYSTAFVMDRNYNQVASMKVKMDPDHFAKALAKLGRMYNNALLAPEMNSVGYAVLSRLRDEYTHIYNREEFDELADKRLKKLGWHTNVKSKNDMITGLRAAVRDNAINIRDPELYKEMMTLVYEPDGNIILNSKDLVVSACIAIQALKQAPLETLMKARYPNYEPKPKLLTPLEVIQRNEKNKGRMFYD